MKSKKIFLLVLPFILFGACKSTQQSNTKVAQWYNIVIAEGVEIFVDTASIKHEGAITYATEKRIYATPEAKKVYVDNIRKEYAKMGKAEKADKWNDFSYSIYNCLYECTNKRFRILSIEDFDSTGKRIVKTMPAKNKIQWLNIDAETVGDYTFFYVCDYEDK